MAWGKVNDQLYGSPKWRRTSKGGRALWVTALSWCMSELTDGHVPADMLTLLGASKVDAAALVKSGLWHVDEGGWRFHDWLDYQPSRAQVLSDRQATADRQRRARDRAREEREAKSAGIDVSSRRDMTVSHGVSHGPPDPTRPDPTRPLIRDSPLGGNSPKQGEGFDPQPCEREHDPADACGACGTARKEARKAEEQSARDKSARDRRAQEQERAQRQAEAQAIEVDPEAGRKAIEKVKQALNGQGESNHDRPHRS